MCNVVIHLIFVFFSLINITKCTFCSENLQDDRSSDLRFNKELSRMEYGINKYSKKLHCCAANYKTILWFKDNKQYPWKNGESNFVVDSKSQNQTLVVEELSKDDAGIYSCYIMNESFQHIRRMIPLKVFDIEFSGFPQMTFIPHDRVYADLNETARLYCESFVGKIDLPDARNKISWSRMDVNNTRTLLLNNTRTSLIKVIRDGGQTLGLYLILKNVKPKDYGQYICSVSNTDDQITEIQSELMNTHQIFSKRVLYMIAVYVICGLILVAIIMYIHFKINYKLQMCIRKYSTVRKNDS